MAENARIKSTTLGLEDHGIMTFVVELDFGWECQGFGGYALDTCDSTKKKRVPTHYSVPSIRSMLEVAGVTRWEDMVGKYVRVDRGENDRKIYAVGHIVDNKWCRMSELTKKDD